MTQETARDAEGAGFGLVEVIVSMALLMVIALAMLPVFINTLYLSDESVSITTASQLVSEQMDSVRAIPQTCAAMHDFEDQVLGRIDEDPRGLRLVIKIDVPDTCPVSYPSAFRLTVSVEKESGGDTIASAETNVVIMGPG